jgi:CO/xanthine dehydrogenase Mo-binding subunit
MNDVARFTRRSVLGGGALIVAFSLAPGALAQAVPDTAQPAPQPPRPPQLPGSLNDARLLDAWIKVDRSGAITVFTGKAELGQGLRTAILQVAAEELEVPFEAITLVTADTGRTPDEGFTAGSNSMPESATAVRHAAAQVRAILIREAATRLGVPGDQLRADGGFVLAPDGKRLGYGEVVSDNLLHVEASPMSPLKDTGTFKVMGRPIQRVDIPPKVTGGAAYVHDLRLDGMLHARVVRPPGPAATLMDVDQNAAAGVAGLVQVVRDGNFLAVVAEREFEAIKAMRLLAAAARWSEQPSFPDPAQLYATLQQMPSTRLPVKEQASAAAPAVKTLSAAYTRPYQMHASIGPSCAVAEMKDGMLTIWSHTQGVYPDRKAIAEMLAMPPEAIRIIHMEGAGCYGHNGADDAAADAALIARAVPGRPVRVQWMREQEHAWEPYGPAMVTKVSASLDGQGTIVDWRYELWSNTHATRPGPAGALLPARHLASPFSPEAPEGRVTASGSGDRNAVPLYKIPNLNVFWNFLPDMPLRVSALRALGAYANVYSIETFMDELAAAAGMDPVEFRLKHLEDERAREVVRVAAERFGWGAGPPANGRGRGFGFARYKNSASYFAVACEVDVDRTSGRVRMLRAVGAIDAGEVINPDGLRNQSEGGIIQAMSWTLYEAVSFDQSQVTSVDWATYPILRFSAVPDSVEIHVVDRPGMPFLGAGEAAQGPAAAAVGNAVAHATGGRFYDLPITRDRVRAGLAPGGTTAARSAAAAS